MAQFRYDPDLEFLQYASNDQLAILVSYLTTDKDGKKRYAESLTSNSEFKQAGENYRKVWELIATEIQLYGGDSIVNFFRNSGVTYREILMDVCEKINIENLDRKGTIEQIENSLILELFNKVWDDMDELEREQLKKELDINPTASLSDFVYKVSATGILSIIIAGVMARGMGLTVANIFAGRFAGLFFGPIGIGVSVLSLVPLMSGAAYRITFPLVVQIAAMRQEYLRSYKDK